MADYRVTWDKKKENELIDFFEGKSNLPTLFLFLVIIFVFLTFWNRFRMSNFVDNLLFSFLTAAHPCLWDHNHIDYFRRDVRDALMKELSNRLGCDRSGQIYTGK